MKKNKIKAAKYESNDTKEIKGLIIITLIVILIIIGLFFLTNFITNKKDSSSLEFNYDTCLVGTMFNRPYDNYYVFLYSSKDLNASTYRGLITNYSDKDSSKKVYYVDLDDYFNKAYLAEESNKNAIGIDDLKIKDSALVYINDGKIVKYYETLEEYKNVLE